MSFPLPEILDLAIKSRGNAKKYSDTCDQVRYSYGKRAEGIWHFAVFPLIILQNGFKIRKMSQ